MTTIYRTTGAWGPGKGAPLTWAEEDTNFYDKETRLNAIEAAGVAVGIDSITVSGDQMTITMTDASIQGPFTLPTVAWTVGGVWEPSTLYQALTVLTYGGSAYLVSLEHTSALTFDPNATSGSLALYELLWSFAPAPGFERNAATFSPTLADANSYNVLTFASGCAVTIDPAEGFDDWTEFHFRDQSSDTGASCTFAVSAPGTLSGMSGYMNETAGQGSVVTIKKFGATDTWHLFGHLATA